MEAWRHAQLARTNSPMACPLCSYNGLAICVDFFLLSSAFFQVLCSVFVVWTTLPKILPKSFDLGFAFFALSLKIIFFVGCVIFIALVVLVGAVDPIIFELHIFCAAGRSDARNA